MAIVKQTMGYVYMSDMIFETCKKVDEDFDQIIYQCTIRVDIVFIIVSTVFIVVLLFATSFFIFILWNSLIKYGCVDVDEEEEEMYHKI